MSLNLDGEAFTLNSDIASSKASDEGGGVFPQVILEIKMSRCLSCSIIPTGDSPENFGRTTLANVSAK